jgi:cytochrome c peroxidase
MRPLALLALLGACVAEVPPEAALPEVPADFPDLPAPDDNAPTPQRIALGRRLFHDRRLSRTGEIACASCHEQAHGFADPRPVSTGVQGRTGVRNAPGLANLAWGTSFFWDGGAATLEHQAVAPIRNPLEMDMTLAEVNTRLAADPGYRAAFQRAYGEGPSEATLPRALASFVRALVSGNSRYDRYRRGDTAALSAAEARGQALFNGEKAECFHCHPGWNFTNNGFRNDGIAADDPDVGRALLTGQPSDRGKFKVPSLRNVAVTAPYMHDGALATLEAVIDAYDGGGRGHPETDPAIRPLHLTPDEKADLAAFLRALTDETFLQDRRFSDRD